MLYSSRYWDWKLAKRTYKVPLMSSTTSFYRSHNFYPDVNGLLRSPDTFTSKVLRNKTWVGDKWFADAGLKVSNTLPAFCIWWIIMCTQRRLLNVHLLHWCSNTERPFDFTHHLLTYISTYSVPEITGKRFLHNCHWYTSRYQWQFCEKIAIRVSDSSVITSGWCVGDSSVKTSRYVSVTVLWNSGYVSATVLWKHRNMHQWQVCENMGMCQWQFGKNLL